VVALFLEEEARMQSREVGRPDTFKRKTMLVRESLDTYLNEDKERSPGNRSHMVWRSFLNTTDGDDNFRRFTGHIRFKATPISSRMKYPTEEPWSGLGCMGAVSGRSDAQCMMDDQLQRSPDEEHANISGTRIRFHHLSRIAASAAKRPIQRSCC